MLILIINNDSTHTRTYNEWKLLFINISCKVHRWYPSSIVWEKQKIVILINLWTKERKIFIVKTFIPLSHVCKQMIKIHCQQVFFSVFFVCVCGILIAMCQASFRKTFGNLMKFMGISFIDIITIIIINIIFFFIWCTIVPCGHHFRSFVNLFFVWQ